MSEQITNKSKKGSAVIDLPIVDLLYFEPLTNAYVITFIPEEAVSTNQTEAVEIERSTEQGQHVESNLGVLSSSLGLGGDIQKLFHRGGDDYGVYGPGSSEASIAGSAPTTNSQAMYAAIHEIAQTAQELFLLRKNPPPIKTLKLTQVAVTLRNGQTTSATTEGNNASWMCVCGYKLPLLGTTRPSAADTRCPNCGRIYRVLPFPHSGAKVESVQEIEPAQLSA